MQMYLTKKSKITEKEFEERKAMTSVLGKEIFDLANKNSSVKDLPPDETLFSATHLARTQKQRHDHDEAKARRANRRHKDKDPLKIDKFDGVEMDVKVSQQEQAFIDLAAINVQEQDALLDEISAGLEELKMLSLDMNKHLDVQAGMIQELDVKMDKTLFKMESANSRLADVLKESGGVSRWCPLLVCILLLLALIGYIINISSK